MAPRKIRTLRRRLLFLFAAIIGFFCILALSYFWANFELRSDIEALRDFYELANNVLEARRYEKNLLYHVGKDNYAQLIYYVKAIDWDIKRLDKSMKVGISKEVIKSFKETLIKYHFLIEKGYQTGYYHERAIRRQGEKLVDLSKELLEIKQRQIHEALDKTMMGFLLSTTSVFIFVLLVFHYHYSLILGRIRRLQKATVDVARGTFTPIPEDDYSQDEISSLIKAFNKMVKEIDSKQEQLLQARKLAAIGTFSSGIAHEINNPLNNILLTADTLEEEFDVLSEEEAREMVHDIIYQTERASKIVRNLLDFSRETEPEQRELNIRDVIEKTRSLVQNQLTVHGIRLEDLVPEDLPPILGDPHQLQQVFLNLFVNAVHAMKGQEGGKITISGRKAARGFIRIDFSDTGCGIAEKDLKRIFDPFFTTKEVGEGTGLGLSIVYGIIKKHKGYIEVHSTVGKGTTFSIYLPTLKPVESKPEKGA